MESGDSTTIGDGRYAIDRRVGVGGCGAVYLCHDTVLNRWVAIKRVEPEGGISDPFREARQLASLQHPNIVTVYDFFRSTDGIFVVMEFVSGQNLNELTDPMEAEFFILFARQCLEGLAAAHSIGMVHRDIKPANIMLSAHTSGELQVKLLDFGLAKVMSEPSEQSMDHSGAITGSIHTISPEQLSRLPMDHRADLYSLGCVFYKVLTLQFPFNGTDVPSLIAAHLQHDFTPLAKLRPNLPTSLTAWVERLFSYNQVDRPQTASEAIQELNRITPKTTAANRSIPAGKLPLATQAPPNKSHSTPPADAKERPVDPPPPFLKSQNFTLAMVAIIAVCLTLATLALTGNFGGGGSAKSHPFAKKGKPTPTPAARTSFKSTERSEIKDLIGKRITITGAIDRLEKDDKGKYLIFLDSDPRRDVMIFFDASKTEAGDYTLKRKFAGQSVQASGVVKLDGSRLLLEMASLDDLKLRAAETAPPSQ